MPKEFSEIKLWLRVGSFVCSTLGPGPLSACLMARLGVGKVIVEGRRWCDSAPIAEECSEEIHNGLPSGVNE
jgi:hypothetical protein